LYDFGSLKTTSEIEAAVQVAGTTSILALLQSPIQTEQIIDQVVKSARNAIRRLSAFRIIDNLIDQDTPEELYIEIVAWFTSFQSGSKVLLHYTDGIKGCG
jgi:hypothetical protein